MIKLCKAYRKYSSILKGLNQKYTFSSINDLHRNFEKNQLKKRQQLPILIVGGGIAGLTLARSCQIAKIPYLLFEKADQFHIKQGAGTGIGLWSPAQRIINAIGVGNQIRNVSERMGCAGYRTKQGKWLAKPPPIIGKKITSCLTLLRGDLISIMTNNLQKQKLFTGHQFLSYKYQKSETSEKIKVKFTNGKQYEGSLLIGADGINSGVRKQLYPEIKSVYCGYSYYRAVADIKTNQHQWGTSTFDTAWESWAQDCRIAYVPLKSPKIFWFISKAMTEQESNKEFQVFHGNNRQSFDKTTNLNNYLNQKNSLKDWHTPIKTLIQKTPQHDILFTPIRKIQLNSSKWIDIDSKIVLIGDAAHAIPPNLASGGMISMQDAIQLASCLKPIYHQQNLTTQSNAKTQNLHHQLKIYLKTRQLKVKIIQISNLLIAAFGQLHNQTLIFIRDNLIILIPMRLRTILFNALHRFYLGWNYTAPDLGQGLYIRLFKCDHNKNYSLNQNRQIPQLLRLFHKHQQNKKIVHICQGEVQVICGQNLIASLITKMASLPPAMKKASVKTYIHQQMDGTEIWTRQFTDLSTKKKHIFQSIQYMENEDFVQAVRFQGAIDIQILMTLEMFDDERKGFKHVYKDSRIRFFKQIGGGFTIRVPKFLQLVVNASTILKENEDSWDLNVQVRSPNNILWKFLTGKNSIIGGYKGEITKFHKPEIKKYLQEKQNSSKKKV